MLADPDDVYRIVIAWCCVRSVASVRLAISSPPLHPGGSHAATAIAFDQQSQIIARAIARHKTNGPARLEADRSLLLADAERLEDFHHAGGMSATL
jgi:hypothetical protein